MINLKKFRLDTTLLIVTISLIIIFHILSYFNAPWIIYYNTIHQNRHNNILIKGIPFFSFFALLVLYFLLLIKNKYPFKILVPIIIMFIFGVLWILYGIVFDNISITLIIRDTFPPIIMFLPCFFLVGYEDRWWESLKKVIFIVACFFTLYSFCEILIAYSKFGFEYRITYGAPIYFNIIGLYSTYGLITLTDEWKKNKKIITFILIIFLFFNSAILQGRSWFIQTLILFVIYVFKISSTFKTKSVLKILIPLLIIIMTIIIFTINSQLFLALISRFNESGDTRTSQLKSFFSQVSFSQLFIGQGMKAKYTFMGDPNFNFIDNQVLLFMFRYGAIPTFMYFYLLIYPVFKSLIIKNKKIFRKCFVLLSWIAASLGLAVYFNFSFNLANLLIMIYAGRLFYEIKIYQQFKRSI